MPNATTEFPQRSRFAWIRSRKNGKRTLADALNAGLRRDNRLDRLEAHVRSLSASVQRQSGVIDRQREALREAFALIGDLQARL